jgi:tetratricopeptide (TPR) repeat protein
MRFKSLIAILAISTLSACQIPPEQAAAPPVDQFSQQSWNQGRASVLIALAEEQYAQGNLQQGRATIDEAIQSNPQSAAARVISAELYIETNALESASAELDQARQLDPANAQANFLAGLIFQRWNNPNRAGEFYQAACEKAPADADYLLARAHWLAEAGRPDEALTLLQEKLDVFGHNPSVRREIGLLLMREKQYAQAVEMLQAAAGLAPDDRSIAEDLAMCEFYSGQYQQCVATFTPLMRDAKYADRRDLLEAWGQAQLQIGRAREAVRNLARAADAMPESADAWLCLAAAQIQQADLAGAEKSLHKSMELGVHNGHQYLVLGYLRLQQNRNNEALEAFRTAGKLATGDDDLAKHMITAIDPRE